MQNTIELSTLDLGISELEPMEAPGFWDTAAGFVTGTVIGGAVVGGSVYGGIALGVAIT
ncbi:hypothetical protein [Streptomyces sp. RPT161]|uniref:hypothetical protein n=1 Tax=Streptomyces sp. RPT161 TaxID=3015993 RepID=UPI0022B91B46|nr:hypothetical protein [Streptomyces sp. RPT161]